MKLSYRCLAVSLCILSLIACNDNRSEKQILKPSLLSTTLFTMIPSSQTGINFQNTIKENEDLNVIMYEYYHNGGGVCIGDINNDGLEDIYFIGNVTPNKLYLNKGNFKFDDISTTAGVEGAFGLTTGATMVDINNDGFLDIYVCRSGKFDAEVNRNKLFINNKNNTFTESAKKFGLDDPAQSTQAYFFDFDLDDDLDLFLLNHQVTTPRAASATLVDKIDPLAGDKFYVNHNGYFNDQSRTVGIKSNPIGYGLSASVGDVNNDGYPDLYVANDYIEHDYLYINQKNGTFKESIKSATQKISNFSMGTDMGDINNDGWIDIMIADMAAADNYRIKTNMSGMNPARFNKAVKEGFHYQYMFNTLQLNLGPDPETGEIEFSEIGHLANIESTDWSWAPLLADFDNDGYKDLFVSNGLRKEARNNDFLKIKKEYLKQLNQNPQAKREIIKKLLDALPSQKLQNYFFRNNHDLTFKNESSSSGLNAKTHSNGAAYADLDNDGDLDLVINNIDETALVYKNNSHNNFLKVKLIGTGANKNAIGSKVTLNLDNGQKQVQENYNTRGYLSCVSSVLTFGLGQNDKVNNIDVQWNDGSIQNVVINKINTEIIIERKIGSKNGDLKTQKLALFKKVNSDKNSKIRHIENTYNDFEKESLLPHKMSMWGPALAVGDVNQDGLDDFYLGASTNNVGHIFTQNQDGSFDKKNIKTFTADKKSEDIGALLFDADGDADLDLYVCSGSNEFPQNDSAYQDRYYLNDGQGNFTKTSLPKMHTSTSCVEASDFDQDGDLDLFIGGRQTPGKYPYPSQSYILVNNNGVFEIQSDTPLSQGMITDAIWSDYDNDGWMDLITVGEWMPIQFYKNNQGKLAEPISISKSEGWWFSIAEGDFNADGQKEYVCGNLGLNYKYRASESEPFGIHSDDFDGNGTNDIVLSYYNYGQCFPLRGRECSSGQMPFIKEKFPNYDSYGKANLISVYGKEKLDAAISYSAYTFESSIIEIQNQEFKLKALPNEAQISSINDMLVYDINGDGHLDIIAAGNLYGSEVETPRNDANLGTVLLGDGKNNFQALSNIESGFYLKGQVSHLSWLKNAATGKTFVAAVNNAPISVFRIIN